MSAIASTANTTQSPSSNALLRVLNYLVLILGGIVFAYPFLWMISFSFRPGSEISQFTLWSRHFTDANYRAVFTKIPITRAFFNSLFVSSTVTGCVVFFGSIVGYALSRLRFRGRALILALILATMVVPFQIIMIPLYILMVKLHWVDSYLGLIVPYAISPFAILLFRQFFLDVPQDLLDAARIDGCRELGILFRILYPLSRPVIITVAILTFMNTWNDALWPILVIRERTLMTMPQLVTLFSIWGEAEGLQAVQLAAAVLLAMPLLFAYTFFQRYFVESLAASGLKN